jgi:hypothetical protein
MPANRTDNSGALFKNTRKTKDSQPDYTGQALVDGVDYYISAWIKRPPGKDAFMSLAFKPKEERICATVREGGGDALGLDDKIPF